MTKAQRKKVDPLDTKVWLLIGEAAMLMSRMGLSRRAYQVRDLVQQGKIEGRISDTGRYEARRVSVLAYLLDMGVSDAANAD
jgi:hypothetical protein